MSLGSQARVRIILHVLLSICAAGELKKSLKKSLKQRGNSTGAAR